MGILARNFENKNKNVTTPLLDIKYVFIKRKIIVSVMSNAAASSDFDLPRIRPKPPYLATIHKYPRRCSALILSPPPTPPCSSFFQTIFNDALEEYKEMDEERYHRTPSRRPLATLRLLWRYSRRTSGPSINPGALMRDH
jgi:hypothetical protein